MVPALQSGCYKIIWERCADLPSLMYTISAVQHHKKVYIMAGDAPDDDTLDRVYCYNIATDDWEQLPPPGHYNGRLTIINSKVAVIGGVDNVTNKVTNKVSTHINRWTDHVPNLLKARNKPGVVSHSEYVIVAGGKNDDDTINDDIEVLNTTQPYQWIVTSILLPRPMWSIFPTITDNMILIVGYIGLDGMYTTSYRLPVNGITLSTTQQPMNSLPVQWIELPSAPHYGTITIPNSHPPVIMGGYDWDGHYVPTSDVFMLDYSNNIWKKVASLSSPRFNVVVVPTDLDTIFVFGGSTGGEGAAGAKANSISMVQKGRAALTHEVAAIPTESYKCSIQ